MNNNNFDINKDKYKDQRDRKFMYAHNFLIHVSNIAKIMNPTIKEREENQTTNIKKERKLFFENIYNQLKESLESNPNVLRNHLEHFDERLDKWIIESPTHTSIDKNVYNNLPANFKPIVTPDNCQHNYFRNIKDDIIFEFGGDSYNLKEYYQMILTLEGKL